MYERLTEWVETGRAIPRMDMRTNGHDRCMARLAEYEDLGFSPEELKTILAEWETRNEQKQQEPEPDRYDVRPGMWIFCRTPEEAHVLLAYLDGCGYKWPDGTRTVWQDNFFTDGGGTSYSVCSDRFGHTYVACSPPGKGDVPFTELGIPLSGKKDKEGENDYGRRY